MTSREISRGFAEAGLHRIRQGVVVVSINFASSGDALKKKKRHMQRYTSGYTAHKFVVPGIMVQWWVYVLAAHGPLKRQGMPAPTSTVYFQTDAHQTPQYEERLHMKPSEW